MRNIKMIIQYDGSRYKGWQKQNLKEKSVNTIQGKLENVISQMVNEEIQVIGCGRTDSGVHANNSVANFKTKSTLSVREMQEYLVTYLPEDIVIKELREASDRFNSRLSCGSKTYIYTIDNNSYVDTFLKRYAYHVDKTLNVNLMQEAAQYLLGKHDFKSFTSLKAKNGKSTIRTINSIDITEDNNVIKIKINGNGFLLNMVRIISGTLISVGKKEIKPEEIKNILEAEDRTRAGEKAPAKGLCLQEVIY